MTIKAQIRLCPTCKGEGWVKREPLPEGTVEIRQTGGRFMGECKACPSCHGTGREKR